MQVNLNTQNYNNSTNFKALKSVRGLDALESKLGRKGAEIGNTLMKNLTKNNAFNELCSKYDVYVNVRDNGLSLDIFAQDIRKGLFGFLKKKNRMLVCKTSVAGFKENKFKLTDYIANHYVKNNGGLESDINEFFKKVADSKR